MFVKHLKPQKGRVMPKKKTADTDDKCFASPACAVLRERLSIMLDKSSDSIHCDSTLKKLGFAPEMVGGLAPMINSLRKSGGKKPMPMNEVAKAKTVEDLCKYVK